VCCVGTDTTTCTLGVQATKTSVCLLSWSHHLFRLKEQLQRMEGSLAYGTHSHMEVSLIFCGQLF
jgi:hypothetical protein